MRTPALFALGLLALLCACRGTQPYPYLETSAVLARPPIEPDFVIPYGEHERQFGHLRVPDGEGPHPVLIVIHGGCWAPTIDLRYMDSFCEDLTAAGVATWNLEYRAIEPGGSGWPRTFLDVAHGVDALRDIADEHALDLNRVVATGHSAGGHLALWAAARHRVPAASEIHTEDPLPIHAVVSLSGIPDLQAYRGHQMAGCNKESVDLLLGGDPTHMPERYAAGSPAQLLPFGVPQRMITADGDGLVPALFAEVYAEVATRLGEDIAVVTLTESGHFEAVVPESKAFPLVRREILDQFN
jgi:acetyl esterase/lipase